jgi:hypothetical protein
MRSRIVGLLLVALVWIGVAAGQNSAKLPGPAKVPAVDQALTRSLDQVLKDVSSIQPGMSRADLLRVFLPEPGLSTRDGQQFVYRRCPYIKVIVNFHKPDDADVDWGNAPEEEWDHDQILSISKPFLESSAPE